MYILVEFYTPVERKAKPGEYVEHKETGDIEKAYMVSEFGSIVIKDDILPSTDLNYEWFPEEYLVLQKVTKGKFIK